MREMIGWAAENKSKALAILVSIIYLSIAFVGGTVSFIRVVGFLIFPLACIFFSEEMGAYTGPSGWGHRRITAKTPGIIVAIMGWVLLLLPVVEFFIIASSKT